MELETFADETFGTGVTKELLDTSAYELAGILFKDSSKVQKWLGLSADEVSLMRTFFEEQFITGADFIYELSCPYTSLSSYKDNFVDQYGDEVLYQEYSKRCVLQKLIGLGGYLNVKIFGTPKY